MITLHFNQIRLLILLSFLFQVISSEGQDNDELISNYLKSNMMELEKNWNDKGYWGDALENIDNRYNEAITFYFFMEEENVKLYNQRIKKAIEFSFDNLQGENGAFLQNNRPSHIRTSLFLHGIGKISEKHPDILENTIVKKGIRKACNWLKEPHAFATNHNMAAMLAMYSLYHSTCDIFYFDLFKLYRDNILKNYIPVDEENGYWPEAPSNWRNRLNVPYLLVQSFLLQEYLLINEDEDVEMRFNKLVNFVFKQINVNKCSINVRNSIGNFKKNNIKDLNISVASFFWMHNLQNKLTKRQQKKLLIQSFNFFDSSCKKAPVLLYTDLYYRFAIINQLK
ncbi:hypothetical protein D1815_16895 [Aquimarina sp. AD1]|uniref:hypothetical protein n=1 Tax=Aquimarina sp. (strain AD1) TaxID=1714848 RepID=UPI000E4A6D06|nr:hypothetical protein [Aquimarina sp. AD1]AXT57339.1 hypothetical protein D1815_16895 [Aquimarina sp. AD1]